MKIACFSDLHIHNFKEFDKVMDGDIQSYRLSIIDDVMSQITHYCLNNSIDHVLFAGDFFHTRGKVNTVVMNAGYDAVKRMSDYGLRVVLLVGNHDENSNCELPLHSLHTFKDIPNVTVIGELGLHTIYDYDNDEEANILCVPYNKDAERIRQSIDTFSKENPDLENPILLFHLGVSGAFVGKDNYPMAEAFRIEDLKPEYFDYIVGGHYHKRQFLGGYPHAFYCGSPLQHSFNDEGEDKGIYIIDTTGEESVEFVPMKSPKFITVTSLKEMEQMKDNKYDYFRVQIKEGDLQEFVSGVTEDSQYRLELQKEYEQVTRVDIKAGMGFNQIISKYAEEYFPESEDIGIEILMEVMGDA